MENIVTVNLLGDKPVVEIIKEEVKPAEVKPVLTKKEQRRADREAVRTRKKG